MPSTRSRRGSSRGLADPPRGEAAESAAGTHPVVPAAGAGLRNRLGLRRTRLLGLELLPGARRLVRAAPRRRMPGLPHRFGRAPGAA